MTLGYLDCEGIVRSIALLQTDIHSPISRFVRHAVGAQKCLTAFEVVTSSYLSSGNLLTRHWSVEKKFQQIGRRIWHVSRTATPLALRTKNSSRWADIKWSLAMKLVIKGVHIVPMGMANAFLIEGDDGLTLVDAGYPNKEAAVFGAIRGLGRSANQLKRLIFTHGHPDHIGSGAAIVQETGARTYMHPLDIPMAESGGPFRPMSPAPGLLRRALCKLMYYPDERVEPVSIDQRLTPGEILPIAGGIEVIHAPGHCAGQVALLWRPGRMLFAGDVCMNIMGLGDPVGFESLEEGRASQRELASLSFDAVGFGHGEPIARDASRLFREKWAETTASVES